jgi:hypothetical protein
MAKHKLPPYPAARWAASRVQPYFARHFEAGSEFLPGAESIEAIIDAAFWASLRREEGFTPRISLAYLPPERAGQPLRFERHLSLAPNDLAKLGPAVDRAGIHLGVWKNDADLCVWGTTRSVPVFCFVLEVVSPGLLVIKHRHGEETSKYVNVAVIEGHEVKVLDQHASRLLDCPPLVTTLLGFESARRASDPLNLLVELAVSKRAHGRGGSLLVVPTGSDEWEESIVRPISYRVSPGFAELTDLMREQDETGLGRRAMDRLHRSVDAVAGLTAVDGATIITTDHRVLAFGAKILRRRGRPVIEQVLVTEPVEETEMVALHPSQLGGTRHLSAAQFVQDQRDSVALVASQDGRFTIFAWSPCEDAVHAHRVEALLL